jgi:threonine dehydratase
LNETRLPELKDVMMARRTISRYLKPTPLIYSKLLSRTLGCDAYVKLENLQPTMAFKVRGGVYYMSEMKEEALRRGVITASTGNHAQSVAYAGALFGVSVKIVMPKGVPQLKVDATKNLGAEVIIHGAYYDEANDYAQKLSAEKGYLYIHGINEVLLYPGVATMHLEVIEDLPDVDVVFNPIGGGSGVSGACIVYKTINPAIKVIGVQAAGAPAFYESWKSGSPKATQGVNTQAEGLATGRGYELPLSILRGKLDDVVLVEDNEMLQAVNLLFNTTRQIAELAGAASTAAAVKIKEQLAGKKVVLMLTGGNISAQTLSRVLQ